MIDTVISGIPVGDNHPTRMMAVINLSPESFYSGSIFSDEKSLEHAVNVFLREGADFLDIGGTTTAPKEIYGWAKYVSEEEEMERVKFALKKIREITDIPISIDTQRARVADFALSHGADMVNDVSGLKADEKMAEVVADHDAPLIVMATKERFGDCLNVRDAIEALDWSLRYALEKGIDEKKIVVDPGIGFGKPTESDVSLIRDLDALRVLGRPIMVGISRKSFIGKLTGTKDPKDRLFGSLAATAISILRRIHIIRTHDVLPTKHAILVAESMRESSINFKFGRIEAEVISFPRSPHLILESIRRVGVDERAVMLLLKKSLFFSIKFNGIEVPLALIIKQEALASGADAAIHKDAIDFSTERTDVLIMGTQSQLERISKKLSIMGMKGLDEVSHLIDDIINFYHSEYGLQT
ncbi:MAG: dihydropteroate synthase [Candidatus Asgardarchaeia archaeon]